MRTTYCGLVSEQLMGQTVTLMGWAHRRRDHGGVIFIDLRDREGLVQVVCDPDRAETFKTAEGVRNEYCLKVVGKVRARPRRHRERQPGQRQDRDPVPRTRGAQPEHHAAVPARRRQPQRDHAPDAPRAGPAAPGDAEEPDAALPRGDGDTQVPRRQRLHRHRDADAHQEHARGRARLPGAQPRQRGHVLRAAAEPAALQAVADGGRLRPLLPDHQVLPRRGPARRPAARVHADRHRDQLPRRGRDPRHVRGHDPHGVPQHHRRGPAGLPGDEVRRGHAPLRLRQARPAREDGVHRAHRRDEGRGLQGVLGRRRSPRAGAWWRCGCPAAAR